MEACSLLVNLRERNAELERAAVSGEDRCCVTTLIKAAKKTRNFTEMRKKEINSSRNSTGSKNNWISIKYENIDYY